MSNNDNKSFLDPNTIFALIITFALFFGWQQYLKVKYPEAEKNALVADAVKGETITDKVDSTKDLNVEKAVDNSEPVVESVEAKLITIEDEYLSFNLNSKGMKIENVVIKNINKVENRPYEFKYPTLVFPTYFDNKVLNFDLKQLNETTFEGYAKISGDKAVKKTLSVDTESFSFSVKIEFVNFKASDAFKISHPLNAKIEDPDKVIFFLPAFDRNEFYVEDSEGTDRRILKTKDVSNLENFSAVKLYSLSDHYFSIAFLSKGKLLPNATFQQNESKIDLNLSYDFSGALEVQNIEYSMFIGPKRLDLLEKEGPPLIDLIDFTFLGFIARPIVKALNLIYGFVGNYGLAVIILTFLIRLLIMPLAISSFKSMNKMKKIQPKLKEIKEKYKDDKQKVNVLTMQIMKENNVNPMGGCLPLLLQMPIFFAYYRGLSESVDLYQAPFAFWIDDLSKVDPYFVLPILFIIGMVVHQLITPNTMEKAQKRMMMLMPLVFGFFIFTLPSALTLYMVITTWFGIAQHAIFLREKES